MVRWVITRLQVFCARRNVAIYDQMIASEQASYECHDSRMRALYHQRADEQAVINRLVGHTSGLDWGLAGKWDVRSNVRQGN
jgi:hypothetical protein